jgi:hypothetical protein
MPWYKRIQNIDRRIIYIILFFAIAIPLISPMGLPISLNDSTKDAYNTIANLPAGSRVLYSFDCSASSAPENKPAALAMIRLSLEKKHKVYIFGTWADGPTLATIWVDPLFQEMKSKYGEDYINIGYRTPAAAILETMRTDFNKAVGGVDINKKPLSDFPIMKDVKKASDLAAVVALTSGDPGLTEWINFWYATGGVKNIVGACTAVDIPTRMNNYRAGQMKGLVGGMRGAAEFEKMNNKLGEATVGMDAQSMGHLAIIVFLVIGNIGYLAARQHGDTK